MPKLGDPEKSIPVWSSVKYTIKEKLSKLITVLEYQLRV